MTIRLLVAVFISLFVYVAASAAMAAQVEVVAKGAGTDSERALFDVLLRTLPGEEVAGLQFDAVLTSGPWLDCEVLVGTAARRAEKAISTQEQVDGALRVLIVGLNTNSIDDGAVAQIKTRTNTRIDKNEMVEITRVVLSDPFGNRVPLTYGASAQSGAGLGPDSSTGSSSWIIRALAVVMVAGVVVGWLRKKTGSTGRGKRSSSSRRGVVARGRRR